MTKICAKCGVEKDLDCFHITIGGKYGRNNSCKECRKIYADARSKQKAEYDRARYMSNPERSHELSNKWRLANPKRMTEIRRLSSLRNPESIRKRCINYRKNNPEKYRAHGIVSRAIESGRLVRQPCEICGTTNHVHGHHEDYTQPLVVAWLCAQHHRDIHNGRLSK